MNSDDVLREARNIQDGITRLRRTLHQHPERQYEEFRTSQLVQDTLAELV